MSVILLDSNHIAAMVGLTVRLLGPGRRMSEVPRDAVKDVDLTDEEVVARMLVVANVRAHALRYPNDAETDPTFYMPTDRQIEDWTVNWKADPVLLLRAITCYECQVDAPWGSDVGKWLAMAKATAHNALPGFREMPWEIRQGPSQLRAIGGTN